MMTCKEMGINNQHQTKMADTPTKWSDQQTAWYQWENYFRLLLPQLLQALAVVVILTTTDKANSHLQNSPVYVEWRHNFWESQVLSDSLWYTDLIDPQVRIRGDDCTRWEVDSLTHQVTTYSTFLAFQTLLNWFQWTTGFLCGLCKQHMTSCHMHATCSQTGMSLSTWLKTEHLHSKLHKTTLEPTQCRDKVKHGCTTNYNPSPIQQYQSHFYIQTLMAKSLAKSLLFKSVISKHETPKFLPLKLCAKYKPCHTKHDNKTDPYYFCISRTFWFVI